MPIGTVVEIQMALNDPVLLARDLGYHDFDFDLYYRDLENIGPLLKGQIDTIQIYILGWFLGRTINPRALFYLERRKIAELLIFAKTALIHSNHALIGLLLGSVRSPETKYINVVMRNTLKPQLVQNLRRHFRFAMQETRADKKDSVIERTISEICKEIINSIWMPVGETGRFGSLITHEGYLEIRPTSTMSCAHTSTTCWATKTQLSSFKENLCKVKHCPLWRVSPFSSKSWSIFPWVHSSPCTVGRIS